MIEQRQQFNKGVDAKRKTAQIAFVAVREQLVAQPFGAQGCGQTGRQKSLKIVGQGFIAGKLIGDVLRQTELALIALKPGPV